MTLQALNEERMRLYRLYLQKRLNLAEYLRRLRPLDEAVDRIEMAMISCSAFSEKAPSKKLKGTGFFYSAYFSDPISRALSVVYLT
jgi:hypothetical protein